MDKWTVTRIGWLGVLVVFLGTIQDASGRRVGVNSHATPAALGQRDRQVPLRFEPNHGQTESSVKFLARGAGYTLFLRSTDAVLNLAPAADLSKGIGKTSGDPKTLRLQFQGVNPEAILEGRSRLAGNTHYLVGRDPARWHTNVPAYAQVHYLQVYPGIDLTFYGNQQQLEFDFVVHPHADSAKIQLGFDGFDILRLEETGDLVGSDGTREVRFHKPVIYQKIGGVKRPIGGAYDYRSERDVRFRLASYDPRYPVIIDPVVTIAGPIRSALIPHGPSLSFSTYLGGLGSDLGYDVTVDQFGSVYVTGTTDSSSFPTANAVQPTFGGGQSDAFITKFSSNGLLVYSTYLGGSSFDSGLGIAVDGSGNAYVTGSTNSADFPSVNPFQSSYSGGICENILGYTVSCTDAFVAKLSPDGSSLIYATYLGGQEPLLGSAEEGGRDITVDGAGQAYVTGVAASYLFPVTGGAFQTIKGGASNDVFVTKLAPNGASLVYSTFLGGASSNYGEGIAVDTAGHAYVTGWTKSTNFPTTTNAFQPTYAGNYSDAFVAKLNPNGTGLVYSSYLGGGQGSVVAQDKGFAIAIDDAGNAYVTGATSSSDFPTTTTSFQPSFAGNGDAFIVKVTPDGSALVYSTFLGSPGTDFGFGIAVDACGQVVVTGSTDSPSFPLKMSLQPTLNGTLDAFVTKVTAKGSKLIYSSLLGGSNQELGYSIALDMFGHAFVIGQTSSSNFPTKNPFQAVFGGGYQDTFVARIDHDTICYP